MDEPPRHDVVVCIVVAVLALAVLPMLWGAVMMPMMGPWITGGWAAGGNPWWGLLSLAVGLLMIGGLALILTWALRRGDGRGSTGDERALAILKERYARGELSHEEYERMRRVLTGQG
jgi:putative membrane protein